MNSRERMITAFLNQKPDRVPVAPDISCMIPARLTGKPFWDVFYYNDPPLWKAYIEAVKKFGFDAWFIYAGDLKDSKEDKREFEDKIILKNEDRMVVRTTIHTPQGDLWYDTTYLKSDSPTVTIKPIKDFVKDFKYLKYFYPAPETCNDKEFQMMRRELGDLGVISLGVELPGLQNLLNILEGGMEAVSSAYYDHHDLVVEWARMYEDWAVRMVREELKSKPDFIFIHASGLFTLQSPQIFRELGLTTLQKVAGLCKEAGIPSFLHACGREKEFVEMAYNETDLNVVNPLESPPMGDCELIDIKKRFGDKLALMGNIHTTEVMLRGSPRDVERVAKKCIDDTAENGGFILSTGDQCGRDTPDENIYKLVEVAETYGRY